MQDVFITDECSFEYTQKCLQRNLGEAYVFAPCRQDIYGNDELDAGKHWWHTRYFVHTAKYRPLAVR
jgi:hypothetical protein